MRFAVFLTLLGILLIPRATFSQNGSGCKGEIHDLVKPFVGTWEEYTITDSAEVFVGTLHASLDLDNCVFKQQFKSADGAFSFLSFGYVDPASKTWYETFVFNNGGFSEFRWLKDGKDIIVERIGGSRKLTYLHRLRLTNISQSYYSVVEEHSEDDGKTWKAVELTLTKRIK